MKPFASKIKLTDTEKYQVGRAFYKLFMREKYTVKLWEIKEILEGRVEPERLDIILTFINDITPEQRVRLLKSYYKKKVREKNLRRKRSYERNTEAQSNQDDKQ